MGGPSDARSSHRARPPCEEPCIYALNDISFVLKYKFLGIDTWTDVSLTFSQLQEVALNTIWNSYPSLIASCMINVDSKSTTVSLVRLLILGFYVHVILVILINDFYIMRGWPARTAVSHTALVVLFHEMLQLPITRCWGCSRPVLDFFSSKSGVAVLTQDYYSWWHCVKHTPKGQMSHFILQKCHIVRYPTEGKQYFDNHHHTLGLGLIVEPNVILSSLVIPISKSIHRPWLSHGSLLWSLDFLKQR